MWGTNPGVEPQPGAAHQLVEETGEARGAGRRVPALQTFPCARTGRLLSRSRRCQDLSSGARALTTLITTSADRVMERVSATTASGRAGDQGRVPLAPLSQIKAAGGALDPNPDGADPRQVPPRPQAEDERRILCHPLRSMLISAGVGFPSTRTV